MSRILMILLLCLSFISHIVLARGDSKTTQQSVESLDKPLYSPFVERYVLDELKQLRIDMAAQKVELVREVVDREVAAVDKAVTYATDTVTYFFYLIAGVSSILVLVGWTSIRDIKERVHSFADEEISGLIKEYEQRLQAIERQLNQKTKHIEENREQLELTQEIQALWLRVGQETNPSDKITLYDQILTLRADDCEALTYKADAVLELGEPQWASNLCHQALAIDPDNGHAFYQLACAYTEIGQYDDAVRYLASALRYKDSYRDELYQDPVLEPLHDYEPFKKLAHPDHRDNQIS